MNAQKVLLGNLADRILSNVGWYHICHGNVSFKTKPIEHLFFNQLKVLNKDLEITFDSLRIALSIKRKRL